MKHTWRLAWLALAMMVGLIPAPARAQAWPEPGQVVFNELFIDPVATTSEQHEFVELLSVAPFDVDLDGCILIEGAASYCLPLDRPGNCDFITADVGDFMLRAGGLALLARSTTLSSECGLTPMFVYDSLISLNNSGAETIELYCPYNNGSPGMQVVAAMTYNWAQLGGTKNTGRTWSLDPARVSDPTDASNWCVSEVASKLQFCGSLAEYGTPGRPNVCPELQDDTPLPPTSTPAATPPPSGTPAATPAPTATPIPSVPPPVGGVVITELMISPSAGGAEWIELQAMDYDSAQPWDLAGCTLREGPCSDVTDPACSDACTENCKTTWHDFTVASSLPLASGGRVLLQSGSTACTAYNSPTTAEATCLATPDVSYNQLSLNDSGTEHLFLMCPGTGEERLVIDQVSYAWASLKADCGTSDAKGCSYALAAEKTSASANDLRESWCVADATSEFFTSGGASSYGTPGRANTCPLPPERPPVGEVFFTEIQVTQASGTAEWFELATTTAGERGPWDLDGCTLREGVCATFDDPTCTWNQFTFQGTTLVPTSRPFLAQKAVGCTAYASAEAGGGCLTSPDATYSTLGFNDTRREYLHLACPDASGALYLVDSAPYEWALVSQNCDLDEKYCSMTLDPESLSAAANDDSASWCAAGAETSYFTAEGDVMYGSPAATNVCPFIPPKNKPAVSGSLYFTELMVDPSSDSPEWVELTVDSAVEWQNLMGCTLKEGPCNTPDDPLCAPGCTGESCKTPWKQFTFEESLPAELGDVLLLSKADACVAYGLPPEEGGVCLAPAAGNYTSLSFNNSGREYLHLVCPDDVSGEEITIDSTSWVWDQVEELCELEDNNGCSLQLREDSLSADGNDLTGNWCVSEVPPLFEPFYSAAGSASLGTPGETSSCPERDQIPIPPPAGAVAFTELMVVPAEGGVEWVELLPLSEPDGASPYNLKGCILQEGGCADPDDTACDSGACTGSDCPSIWHRTTLGDLPAPALVPLVLANSAPCVAWSDSEEERSCEVSATAYTSLGFNNDEPEYLFLRCRDSSDALYTVDRIRYDSNAHEGNCTFPDDNDGCSIVLEVTDEAPAEANDLDEHWCGSDDRASFLTQSGALSYGSPGAANAMDCPEPTPTPTPRPVLAQPPAGSLIFNEVQVNPEAGGIQEWIELRALVDVDAAGWTLEGCVLYKGPCDDPLNPSSACAESCEGDGCSTSWSTYTFKAGDVLTGTGPFLLQRTATNEDTCIAWERGQSGELSCAREADVQYSTVDLVTSADARLHLICGIPSEDEGASTSSPTGSTGTPGPTATQAQLLPGYAVDSANYGEDDFDEECSATSEDCTLSLDPSASNTTSNDSSRNWCTAPFAEGVGYYDATGALVYGTPGWTNPVCPDLPEETPGPGTPPPAQEAATIQVVFTEVMVSPEQAPSDTEYEDTTVHEWFEWVNLGDERVSLSGCTVETGKLADEGDPEKTDLFPLEALGGNAYLDPGERALAASDGCLVMGPSVFTGEGSEMVEGEVCRTDLYSPPSRVMKFNGLSFTDDVTLFLSLKCTYDNVTVEIDRVTFDSKVDGIDKGRSWQVKPEMESAPSNDDTANWCQGSRETAWLSLSGAPPNHGTPGEVNNCGSSLQPVHGCHCDASADPASRRGMATLLGIGLLFMHRRRRQP